MGNYSTFNLNDIHKPIFDIKCNLCNKTIRFHAKSSYRILRTHLDSSRHLNAIKKQKDLPILKLKRKSVTRDSIRSQNNLQESLEQIFLEAEKELNFLREDLKELDEDTFDLNNKNQELKRKLQEETCYYKKLIIETNNKFEQDKTKLNKEKLILEKQVLELEVKLNKQKHIEQEQNRSHSGDYKNLYFFIIEFIQLVKDDLNLDKIDIGGVLEDQDPLENSNSYLNFLRLCIQSKLDLVKEEYSSNYQEKLHSLKEKLLKLQFNFNIKPK